MSHMLPRWIHIAGNPSGVISGNPPYWRYRFEGLNEVSYFDTLMIRGRGTEFNNRQGVELGASFLLWWSLYGCLTSEVTSGKRRVAIALDYGYPTTTSIFNHESSQEHVGAERLRIFGAPDRVTARSHLRWRAVYGGQELDLATWVFLGDFADSFSLGQDIENEDKLRRLWLEFWDELLTLKLDCFGNAIIEL